MVGFRFCFYERGFEGRVSLVEFLWDCWENISRKFYFD